MAPFLRLVKPLAGAIRRGRLHQPGRPPPNGQVSQPRALADLPHVEALRRLRAAGCRPLLLGQPGTGKTSLIEAAFPT